MSKIGEEAQGITGGLDSILAEIQCSQKGMFHSCGACTPFASVPSRTVNICVVCSKKLTFMERVIRSLALQ
jgi:hypothetical protein